MQDFLAAVIETSQTRKDSIEKSSILWRAQRVYIWRKENPGTKEEFEVPDAFDPERMVPKAELVSDGRVNPRGIPCLYLGDRRPYADQTGFQELAKRIRITQPLIVLEQADPFGVMAT